MMYLTEQQRQQFDRDGFLVVDAAIEIAEILRLRRQFEIWVAESCAHAADYAEDVIELSPNPLPSRFAHEIVRGSASGRIRCTEFSVPIPAVPKATSFFAQQEGLDVVNTKTD